MATLIGFIVFRGGKWDRYYKNKMYQPPREVVVNALDFFQTHGNALDLGCGVGNETAYLLDNGWDVWAIDCEPKAIEIMKGRRDISASHRQLVTKVAKFEDLNWKILPQFDLICACNSLPFCESHQFPSVFASIKEKINPNGRFAGHFFGMNYSGFSSAEKNNMTFLTKEQIIKLLDGFDIEYLQEIEEDGISGTGLKCHSHIFYVIARKMESVSRQPDSALDQVRITEGKKMDYEKLKIKSYKYWDLYLHENQCYLGRVFVQLKDEKEVEDFLDIQGQVREEFFQIGQTSTRLLRSYLTQIR